MGRVSADLFAGGWSGFHGFSNSACEVGYVYLSDGAFKDVASTALVNYVTELTTKNLLCRWTAHFQGSNRNARCIKVLRPYSRYLEQGIANVLCSQSEVVILGGGDNME